MSNEANHKSPTDKDNVPPRETIEVRSYEIGSAPIVGDYSHAFIVYTNDEGQEFFLRGGPDGGNGVGSSRTAGEITGGGSANPSGSSDRSNGSSNPSRTGDSSFGRPYGNIATDYGAFVSGSTYDYGRPGTVSIVVAEGEDLSDVYEQLKVQADKIEDAGIRYNPLGPNSNSTVATILDNVGIEPRLPPGVNAPGFGMEDLVSAGLSGEEANPTRYALAPPDAYARTLAHVRESMGNPELSGAEGAAYVAATVMVGLSDQENVIAIASDVLMQSPDLADLDVSAVGDYMFGALGEGAELVARARERGQVAEAQVSRPVADQIEV